MISLENLSKSFISRQGTVVALDGVTMTVPAGTACAVFGSSGSGKSTLSRCVALRERPDAGVIRLDGVDTTALDARRLRATRQRIGVVDAATPLVRERTVAGNIALPLEQAGIDGPQRRSKVGQLLDLIGLIEGAGRRPDELTDGQRRRVAIARALVGDPSVLLADDPTGALARDAHAGVLATLDRVRSELGVTVLVTTSDPAVVRRVCDDVALLDGGRLVEHRNVLDVVLDPDSPTADAVLPAVAEPVSGAIGAAVADVVLVGFAAVGALLPEASIRFGVDIAVLGGGMTRIGETPVARFRIGLCGERVDGALAWISDLGATVRQRPAGPRGVAA